MDHSITADIEAPKDPGALKPNTSVTDNEILGHRNVFVGIHVPGEKSHGSHAQKSGHHGHHRSGHHKPHHRRRHHHLKTPNESHRPEKSGSEANGDASPMTPPAQRVQFILGEDHDENSHQPHPLFSEMEELLCDEDGEMEWKETARSVLTWI